MKAQNVNPTSLVFQQIVSEGLVKDVIEKSIYTVKNILIIDRNNTMDIKVLDDKEEYKPKLVTLLSKAFM